MSTRGAIGFTYKGKDYVTYNHSDSYPSYLGERVLGRIPACIELKDRIPDITLVKQNSVPTEAEKVHISEFASANLNVSNQSDSDWYCVLRELHGDLLQYLECGYMIDNFEFLHDSLFCEWAYIVNFDTNKLEVYKGFQKNKPKGRFSDIKPSSNGYYAVGLVAEFDLDNLPDEKVFFDELYRILKAEDPELERDWL